jgi:hypothetical protein
MVIRGAGYYKRSAIVKPSGLLCSVFIYHRVLEPASRDLAFEACRRVAV